MTIEENGKKKELLSSYHIFLFPFKWSIKSSDTISLPKINQYLDKTDWKRIPSNPTTVDDYNRKKYFHPFAHKSLFDNGEDESIVYRYTYGGITDNSSRYRIYHGPGETDVYDLDINKIELNLYETGVGILAYFLKNNRYPHRNDIFAINDRGRRIYPPFLAGSPLTAEPKKSTLAHRLEVSLKEGKSFKEDFSYYIKQTNIQQNPGRIADTVMNVLGEPFYTGKNPENGQNIHIEPVIDDRMFVLCWMQDTKWCKQLAKYNKRETTYAYETDDDWYSYLFVDGDGPSCKGINKKKQLILDHSDERWLDEKIPTLYGISRYSFVVLTTPDSPDYILPHLQNLYVELVRLSLMQRASILYFSGEVTDLSGKLTENNTSQRLGRLHRQYLQFVNKMYFREVTAQEQGIELYDKLQHCMQTERDVKDLNREIDELHQYVSLEEERENNRQLHVLTIIGALFLLPMFITGFFGMNVFNDKMKIANDYILSFIIIYVLAGGMLTYHIAKKKKTTGNNETKKKSRTKWLLVTLFVITLLLMLLPYWVKIEQFIFGVLCE